VAAPPTALKAQIYVIVLAEFCTKRFDTMINTAICDDEKYFVDKLHIWIKNFFLAKRIDFHITKYSSGKDLLEHGTDCDLLFLDVKMEEQDGFKIAEILRRNGFSGCLIFSTVMKNDMYRAFEYEAFDYLVKPISPEAFEHTMERYIHTLRTNKRQIVVSCRGQKSIVRSADILYCEIINRKINLHLSNGSTVEYYGRISELEKSLDSSFFKSHRSYLVNLQHILRCGSNEIIVLGNEKIPLSRSRRAALMDALMDDIDNFGEEK